MLFFLRQSPLSLQIISGNWTRLKLESQIMSLKYMMEGSFITIYKIKSYKINYIYIYIYIY